MHALLTGPPGKLQRFEKPQVFCLWVYVVTCMHMIYTGIGKTTLVRKVCSLLQQKEDIEAQGFFTEEVRERTSGRGGRGSRIGFDVVTLSGDRAPLSRVHVGRWGASISPVIPPPFTPLPFSLSLSLSLSLSPASVLQELVQLLSISQLSWANIVLR